MTSTSTIAAAQFPTDDWHVLVLHDGEEKDILGIWGPYPSDAAARAVLQELQTWPIDGQWSIFSLKRFSAPNLNINPFLRDNPGYTITWNSGGDIMRNEWNGPITTNG